MNTTSTSHRDYPSGILATKNAKDDGRFIDDASDIGKAVGGLSFIALAITWAFICLMNFGLLGALFVFVLGLFTAGLLLMPLIGIGSMILGFVGSAIVAIAEANPIPK